MDHIRVAPGAVAPTEMIQPRPRANFGEVFFADFRVDYQVCAHAQAMRVRRAKGLESSS